MVEFRRTGDADYPRHLKIVNMAAPKGGKTTFEATAPNVVVLATPNAGLMSIAHLNVPYVAVKHPEEIRQLLMILGSDALRQRTAEQLGMPKVETVALDLLDDVQQMLMKERLRQERRTQMQRDDWGWILEQMREIINGFVQLPLNVIFSVHIKSTQDDESRIIVGPMLQGAIADELAGYVDFVVMSQRTREINPTTGQPFISYTLKVEGDLKNPHLGNRAAGRLPEIVAPDFKVLHDAVFKGIDTLVKHEGIQVQTGVATPAAPAATQEVAQAAGQSPAAPTAAAATPAAGQATGTPQPAADEGDPINEAGMKHLGNFYKDAGLNPPNWDGWTLGEARRTARMFVAVKADIAEGKDNWDTIIEYLKAMETDPSVSFQMWAGKTGETVEPAAAAPAPAAAAPEATPPAPEPAAAPAAPTPAQEPAPAAESAPVAPVQTPVQTEAPAAPSAEVPVTPTPVAADVNASPETSSAEVPAQEPTTEAEALATIQDTLGGNVVEDETTPCVICTGKVDDIDIARLSKARFGKWACVNDYVALTKQ